MGDTETKLHLHLLPACRLPLTTRIRGLIPKGTEVELELLGLQSSVELLASVAELDDAQVPPVCLEIAQLCGEPLSCYG